MDFQKQTFNEEMYQGSYSSLFSSLFSKSESEIIEKDERTKENSINFVFPETTLRHYTAENKGFIDYLDNCFQSELKLEDADLLKLKPEHSSEEEKSTTLVDQDDTRDTPKAQKVKLNYRGQKNHISKGVNAGRKDVQVKTLLRSVRRYLWEIFTDSYDTSGYKKNLSCPTFRKDVEAFCQTHFSEVTPSTKADAEMVVQYISSLLTNKHVINKREVQTRKFDRNLNKVLKNFSLKAYQAMLNEDSFRQIFRVLKSSGIIDEIIQAYPRLSWDDTQASYRELIDSIAAI